MVQTRERNKDTHPGQLVAPKARRSKEQVAEEQAAKAATSKQRADERLGRIAGLASLEQQMMDESRQVMAQAARPPTSQMRKIARTFSVHNLKDSEHSPESAMLVNHDGHSHKKTSVPKLKLREEVQSMVNQQSEGQTKMQGGGGKQKASAELDKDQLNKKAKPSKPFGLAPRRRSPSAGASRTREPSPHFRSLSRSQTPSVRSFSSASKGTSHSRTPSLTQPHSGPVSKPQSRSLIHHQISSSVNMPVDDYGGFHEEDESVEREFALQHERTTLNSETLLQITSEGDESDVKSAIPRVLGTSKSMLPEDISVRFQEVFIPTLLAYCGTTPNPWNLPCSLEDIIAELWCVVFPPTLPYNVQLYGPGTPTHRLARQRTYDWHSGFAGVAEKVTATWFYSDEFSDNESRAAWADWAVDAQRGFPFVFQYMKPSGGHGIGAFRAPLILQTLAYHYTKTANAVSCPQINVYPHGALTLATAAVERAISMWVEIGRQTDESKLLAGTFSEKGQWGESCASYALSIAMLTSTAWGEIEDGVLDFVKHGRRFKPVSSEAKKDPRAFIMDCNSSDDDSADSLGHDDDGPQVHTSWEKWAAPVTDASTSQPTAGTDVQCHPQPPMALESDLCPAPHKVNEHSASHSTSTPDDDSVLCQNDGGPSKQWTHVPLPSHNPFTFNGLGSTDGVYTVSSGLRFRNKFLSGPLATIDADHETRQ
ncbi:hypothetical protein BKA83DRAFT_4121896 [Pisolithus microcarpus]|nr:hypothetical protein BKA83DRAFT_4121896 [Pisolithus microcarpus]